MSLDQLPPDFAPYQLVKLTHGCQGMGCFYDQELALNHLAMSRRRWPEDTWGVLYDGGLLEEACVARPTLKLLRKAA